MNRQAGFAQSSPASASTLPAEALPGIHSRNVIEPGVCVETTSTPVFPTESPPLLRPSFSNYW